MSTGWNGRFGLAGMAACVALAVAPAVPQAAAPVSNVGDHVTISSNKWGNMPADPVGDIARRVAAACGDIPGQPHVTPQARVKSGQACGVLIYGLDGKSPKEYTPYPMFWIVGLDGDASDPTVYVVGAKGQFQIRKKKASELLAFTSTIMFQGTAKPVMGPVFTGGGELFRYSYRTILWPAFCADSRVAAVQGCGATYSESVFHFRDYVARWDRKHRREFEPGTGLED